MALRSPNKFVLDFFIRRPGRLPEELEGQSTIQPQQKRNVSIIYNLSSGALGVGTYRVDIKINCTVVGNAIFQLK